MQYLITVIDDLTDPGRDDRQPEIEVFNEKLIAQGYWVFANGLAAPDSATVVDSRGDLPVVTDGPYVESKEFMAGLWIWDVPDLDIALALAEEASQACFRKIEVRPMHGRD